METTYQILMLLLWITLVGVAASQHKKPQKPSPDQGRGIGISFVMLMLVGHITMWQPGGEPATQMPLLNPTELSPNEICWLIVLVAVIKSLIGTFVFAFETPKEKTPTTKSTIINLLWGTTVCITLAIAIIS